jgi:hypothetical protein
MCNLILKGINNRHFQSIIGHFKNLRMLAYINKYFIDVRNINAYTLCIVIPEGH